jgi:hypothetical protein
LASCALGDAQGFAIQFLGGVGMLLPQQQLALVPIELSPKPTLSCPFDDLQSVGMVWRNSAGRFWRISSAN